jgi:hypothetical protein
MSHLGLPRRRGIPSGLRGVLTIYPELPKRNEKAAKMEVRGCELPVPGRAGPFWRKTARNFGQAAFAVQV